MLETIMLSPDDRPIDVAALKNSVKERAKEVNSEEDYDRIEAELFKAHSAEPPVAVVKPNPDEEVTETAPTDGKEKDKKKKDDTKETKHA